MVVGGGGEVIKVMESLSLETKMTWTWTHLHRKKRKTLRPR